MRIPFESSEVQELKDQGSNSQGYIKASPSNIKVEKNIILILVTL
jgi:hypothetical protein